MEAFIIVFCLGLNLFIGGYCLARFLESGGEGNNIAGLYIKDEEEKKDEQDKTS